MGTAEFKSSKDLEVTFTDSKKKETIQFEKAIVATGSAVSSLPGINIDRKQIVSSTEAISLPEIPKKLVLIGGGYIGMELGSFFSMIGTEVIVLEYAPHILSTVDTDLSKMVEKALIGRGGSVHTSFKVEAAETKGKKVLVRGKTLGDQPEEKTFEADICLVSVGRRPFTDSLSPGKAGIKLDAKGFITVNRSLQTSAPNIYAIGDVTSGPALAHRASHEALVAASHAAGDVHAVVDYKVIPAAIFTDPEIGSVGITETEAKQKGLDVKVGKFPFAALGRSLANNNADGFVKIIGDAKTNDLLGLHVVGPEAGNLIAEGALAMEMGASVEDLALTIHTHPTYPEAIMEAADAYFGHAIHVFQAGHKKPAAAASA
jgi:dihydrolipoamide dehydrogenase